MRGQKISFKGAKIPITWNTDAKHKASVRPCPPPFPRGMISALFPAKSGLWSQNPHTLLNTRRQQCNATCSPPLPWMHSFVFQLMPQLFQTLPNCVDEIGLHEENLKRWRVDSATAHIPLGGFKTTLGRKVSLPQCLSPSRALQPFTIASHLQGSLRLASIWNLPSGKVLWVFNMVSKLVT